MALSVIVLAGGTGSRMGSKIPKVLHKLAGKPLLEHVIHTAKSLSPDKIFVVYGHMGEHVRSQMAHLDVLWIEQSERLGTGHAVMQVLPYLNEAHQVLILYGDVPLISRETLAHFAQSTSPHQLGLLTATVENPTGLGRILRDEYHQVLGIVEHKDASEVQRQIREINTGIYCVPAKQLKDWIGRLENKNSQGEYYLTDIVRFAREDHVGINVSAPRALHEIYGVNTRVELARLERIFQEWQVEKLMLAGTTVMDPKRIDIRGTVCIGQDTTLDVSIVFEGTVVIGEDCYIGPYAHLKDVTLGDGVIISSHCVIEGATIQANAKIGPFARIRPGTQVAAGAHIGNFVEIKHSQIGQETKINHLSYIGDATVGDAVNIGAGVITCNFDGANKHSTTIEDNAFVGSDCQLIAPVNVGRGATIGAGTTLTQDAPEGALTLARTPQKTIFGWVRPKKSGQ